MDVIRSNFADATVFTTLDTYSGSCKIAVDNTSSVLLTLKTQLASIGIEPPFSSREFAKFVTEWSIEHSTSSPYYPWSNRQTCRKCSKASLNFFSKCKDSGNDSFIEDLNLLTQNFECVRKQITQLVENDAPNKNLDFLSFIFLMFWNNFSPWELLLWFLFRITYVTLHIVIYSLNHTFNI